MLNPDTIPRYPDPYEVDVDLTPAQVMQNCSCSSACIRMIERFTDKTFNPKSDSCWRHAAEVADCANCLEYT